MGSDEFLHPGDCIQCRHQFMREDGYVAACALSAFQQTSTSSLDWAWARNFISRACPFESITAAKSTKYPILSDVVWVWARHLIGWMHPKPRVERDLRNLPRTAPAVELIVATHSPQHIKASRNNSWP